MKENTLIYGLRNAVLSFLLLIPYSFLGLAVLMAIGEGGMTPFIVLPAAILGLSLLFVCGRKLLRELPSVWQTVLSIVSLPLLYTGMALLICGKHFSEGIYASFFLSSAAFPAAFFLTGDAPQLFVVLCGVLGILLPFAALYGGTLFQPVQENSSSGSVPYGFFRNGATAFFSWLIAEGVCGVLYLSGIYSLCTGSAAEFVWGMIFAVVLSLTPHIVPFFAGRTLSLPTERRSADVFAATLPFLLLLLVRILLMLLGTSEKNIYAIFPPTTFGFIYFIAPFLPGSEVVNGTMQFAIPNAAFAVLPCLLPPTLYCIGMHVKRKHKKEEQDNA